MSRNIPPKEITLVYRPVGPSHVFTASEAKMNGFHISSPDLRRAFDLAASALGHHVKLIYGVDAEYTIETSFDDFEGHLKGNNLGSPMEQNSVKAVRATHRINGPGGFFPVAFAP